MKYSIINHIFCTRESPKHLRSFLQCNGSLSGNTALGSFFSNPSTPDPNPNAPRAYLTYIFFDEQFNFVEEVSGFKRVNQSGDGADPLILTETKAIRNGYVYIYLSNESSEEVYFDNFKVGHDRGQLIGEDHYYAYGLKIAALSSKSISSSLNQKMIGFGYQGAFSEEINDFELNYNEFFLRNYDPQIGRWTTPDPYDQFTSPYTGVGNDPANGVDPSGGIYIAFSSLSMGPGCGGSTIFEILANISATVSSVTTAVAVSASVISVAGNTFSVASSEIINSSVSQNYDCPDCPSGALAEVKDLKEVIVRAKRKPLIKYANLGQRPTYIYPGQSGSSNSTMVGLVMPVILVAAQTPQGKIVTGVAAIAVTAIGYVYVITHPVSSFGFGSIPFPGTTAKDNTIIAPSIITVPTNIPNAPNPDNKIPNIIGTLVLGKTLNDLVPGSIKHSPSWDDRYGQKTPEEIIELAEKGDKIAQKMKKLWQQTKRLLEKKGKGGRK